MAKPPIQVLRYWGDDDPSPEQLFVAAFLSRAVSDACSRATTSRYDAARIAQAQAWLRDREEVLWWLTQIDLPDTVYDWLLRAAGMDANA